MSSQSMKYHELPSFETLVAYQKGDLSAVDSKWIEQLIQNNPMVKAVVESTSSINAAAVKSVSKRTAQTITTTYYSKAGFWSKYGMWIGLSSIALLLGSTYLYQSLQTDALYEQTALTINKTVDNSNSIQSPKKQSFILASEVDYEEQEDFSDQVGSREETPLEENQGAILAENDKTNTVEFKSQKAMDAKNQSKTEAALPDLTAQQPKEKAPKVDNTRIFTAETSTASKTVILSVQQVQILAKTNPDDFSSSSKKDKGGNPMQTFGQKPGNNSSYSIDDIPKYPGGDKALQNYFVGKLRPIKILEKDNQYDKSVMLDLEINFRGKLKDYTIYGQLHPDHQKALIKAIEEMPRFDKGTENITYSLGIAF